MRLDRAKMSPTSSSHMQSVRTCMHVRVETAQERRQEHPCDTPVSLSLNVAVRQKGADRMCVCWGEEEEGEGVSPSEGVTVMVQRLCGMQTLTHTPAHTPSARGMPPIRSLHPVGDGSSLSFGAATVGAEDAGNERESAHARQITLPSPRKGQADNHDSSSTAAPTTAHPFSCSVYILSFAWPALPLHRAPAAEGVALPSSHFRMPPLSSLRSGGRGCRKP